MNPFSAQTPGDVRIDRSVREMTPNAALEGVRQALRHQAGALFSSGYEYPGRYSRWDIGFTNPPVEFIAKGRTVKALARNEKGREMLTWISTILGKHQHLESQNLGDGQWEGVLRPMDAFFPEEQRSRQPSFFSLIRELNEALGHEEDGHLGLYGAFGYDLVFQFDPITFRHPREDLVEAKLYLPDSVVVVDRRLEKAFELSYDFAFDGRSTHGLSRQSSSCSSVHRGGSPRPDEAKGSYAEKVKTVQEGCRRGDFFEVVLSRCIETSFEGDALDIFERIQHRNPSPYEFLIQLEDEQLVGASPEMFVRVEGTRVETCPISGTVARGESPLEDADAIRELLSSDKEEAELTMCTDVDRNDKSRVCKPETVSVLGRRLIELYSKVIHTVDHVEGELREGMDGLDAFLSHMWAVTLSGSPKKAAMQAIEDLEDRPRAWYGGAVGALHFNGDINTGITIRTVHLKKGVASIRVGATLLAASDPASEERETEIKAEAFVKAVTESAVATEAPPPYLPTSGKGKKVLFVDHQDSFVHTLAGYVRRTGAEVLTLRSGFPMEYLDDFDPDLVFLSPGPFNPSHFGLPDLIQALMKRDLPMFGVCLGLQGMVESMGGRLGILDVPQHGVHAMIEHGGKSVFNHLPSPMRASRYHSLYAIDEHLPDCFEVTARSVDGVIMGLRHRDYPMAAVQFHPESIHALRQDAGLHLIDNVMAQIAR